MNHRRLSLHESSSEDERHFRGAKDDYQGDGFADYILWGHDARPLGLVEAKRTKRCPKEKEQQAKLYKSYTPTNLKLRF